MALLTLTLMLGEKTAMSTAFLITAVIKNALAAMISSRPPFSSLDVWLLCHMAGVKIQLRVWGMPTRVGRRSLSQWVGGSGLLPSATPVPGQAAGLGSILSTVVWSPNEPWNQSTLQMNSHHPLPEVTWHRQIPTRRQGRLSHFTWGEAKPGLHLQTGPK